MSEPDIGGRAPIRVDVEAGKSYWWCACGRSQTQPFCDGSHKVHRLHAGGIEAGGDRQGLLLHLQAHGQAAALRRQPQTSAAGLIVFLDLAAEGSVNRSLIEVPMPDLLLELFSEEIPARMQARAAEDLQKLVTDRLVAAGLRLRRRQGLRDAAAAGAGGARRAGAPARHEGREARARASARRSRRSRAFCKAAGLDVDRSRPRSSRTRRAISTSR